MFIELNTQTPWVKQSRVRSKLLLEGKGRILVLLSLTQYLSNCCGRNNCSVTFCYVLELNIRISKLSLENFPWVSGEAGPCFHYRSSKNEVIAFPVSFAAQVWACDLDLVSEMHFCDHNFEKRVVLCRRRGSGGCTLEMAGKAVGFWRPMMVPMVVLGAQGQWDRGLSCGTPTAGLLQSCPLWLLSSPELGSGPGCWPACIDAWPFASFPGDPVGSPPSQNAWRSQNWFMLFASRMPGCVNSWASNSGITVTFLLFHNSI